MSWQNYNTLKSTIIELTFFFTMDYKCNFNSCEALTLAPDLHQIVHPGKTKNIRGESCECVMRVLFAI